MTGSMSLRRERGDRGQPDRAGAEHEREVPDGDRGAAHVVLADRERVDQRDRVARHAVGHRPGERLRQQHELAEAPGRVRMLTDDVHTGVGQEHRHARDPGPDRELLARVGAVTDHLTDELVTHHDVELRVVRRQTSGIVDRLVGMVHVVDVRRADRGAEDAPSNSPTGHRDRLRLEPPVQHDCTDRCRFRLVIGQIRMRVEHDARRGAHAGDDPRSVDVHGRDVSR